MILGKLIADLERPTDVQSLLTEKLIKAGGLKFKKPAEMPATDKYSGECSLRISELPDKRYHLDEACFTFRGQATTDTFRDHSENSLLTYLPKEKILFIKNLIKN